MGQRLSSRGVLFVFEGIDGAGKTTQARALARHLRSIGLEVVESKEPTNGRYGTELRRSGETGRLSPERELELFMLDRREHIAELIEPSLAAGKVVIVDRYYFSTAAYQGARGMDFASILDRNEEFAPQPDLLFVLQVPPAVGRERIAARGDRANLFEGEEALAMSASIFDRIDRPYLRRINGLLPIGEIEQMILYAANDLIDRRARSTVGAADRDAALRETDAILGDDSIPVAEKAQALLDRLVPKPA